MTLARYRKRPVEVEAMRADGTNTPEFMDWLMRGGCAWFTDGERFRITTLEGDMYISPGDWVIKGVQGEFYPCKDNIFRQTYEPVDDGEERTLADTILGAES